MIFTIIGSLAPSQSSLMSWVPTYLLSARCPFSPTRQSSLSPPPPFSAFWAKAEKRGGRNQKAGGARTREGGRKKHIELSAKEAEREDPASQYSADRAIEREDIHMEVTINNCRRLLSLSVCIFLHRSEVLRA